jgi:hypothetical protein
MLGGGCAIVVFVRLCSFMELKVEYP